MNICSNWNDFYDQTGILFYKGIKKVIERIVMIINILLSLMYELFAMRDNLRSESLIIDGLFLI